MGVIQRQAIRTSIINWAGLLLGILSMVFIVPYDLKTYGLYFFLSGVTLLVAPIIAVGMNLGVVKFYSDFEDGSGKNRGLLTLSIVLVTVSFAVLCLLSYLFKDPIIAYYQNKDPDNYRYLIYAFPLIWLTALFNVVSAYISNFKKIAIPNLLRNGIKIVFPFLLIAVVLKWITIQQFLWGIIWYNVFSIIGLFVYLNKIGEWDIRWEPSLLSKQKINLMSPYLANGVLMSLGGVIAGLIDTVMVGSMIDMGETSAIYGIGTNVANVLIMPNAAIAAVAIPIVSDHWKTNNIGSIQDVYNKSGVTLSIIGVLMFAGMMAGLDDVFALMKDGDMISQKATQIIFVLGLARVISMVCGINGVILSLSPKYAINTMGIIVLGFSNIFLNYFFINRFGAVGAAYATGISISMYNIFVCLYLYYKYGIYSINKVMIPIFIVGFVLWYAALYIDTSHPIVNIFIKSSMITLLFVTVMYKRKYSPDFNRSIDNVLDRIGFSMPKFLK